MADFKSISRKAPNDRVPLPASARSPQPQKNGSRADFCKFSSARRVESNSSRSSMTELYGSQQGPSAPTFSNPQPAPACGPSKLRKVPAGASSVSDDLFKSKKGIEIAMKSAHGTVDRIRGNLQKKVDELSGEDRGGGLSDNVAKKSLKEAEILKNYVDFRQIENPDDHVNLWPEATMVKIDLIKKDGELLKLFNRLARFNNMLFKRLCDSDSTRISKEPDNNAHWKAWLSEAKAKADKDFSGGGFDKCNKELVALYNGELARLQTLIGELYAF